MMQQACLTDTTCPMLNLGTTIRYWYMRLN